MTDPNVPGATLVQGRTQGLSAGDFAVHLIFFLSGFPALVYQIIWQRSLFTIYGVNIESITVVVAAFMLGLGLGSLFGGWLSKNPRFPALAAFSATELVIGLFGLVSLNLFNWVGSFTLGSSPLQAGKAKSLFPSEAEYTRIRRL